MSDLEMDLLFRDSRRCPCGGWLAIECDEFGRALQYCDRCGAVSSAMRTPLVPVEIVVPVYPLCACGRGSVVSPLAHICKLCEQEAKRAAARISMARRRAAAERVLPPPCIGAPCCTVSGAGFYCDGCAARRRKAPRAQAPRKTGRAA